MMVPKMCFVVPRPCEQACWPGLPRRRPRELWSSPGISPRLEPRPAREPALCGRASLFETRNLFPLAPLLDTRFPYRSAIHSLTFWRGPRTGLPRVRGVWGWGEGREAGWGGGGGGKEEGAEGVGDVEGGGSHKGNRSVSLLQTASISPVQWA